MRGLARFTEWVNNVLMGIGGITLVLMTGIACVNMFLRLYGTPLSPAYELVSYLGAITVALPLGYAQLKKSHIAVDIVSNRFSPGTRRVIVGLNLTLSIIFFSLATWKVGQHAANLWQRGELSETTRMPFYPFAFAVAFSCGLLTLTLLVDFLSLVAPLREENK